VTHLAHARERFAAARVARLATVAGDGRPHLVPVVFVLVTEGSDPPTDVVWIAVDAKPKTTRRLKRLANIEAHPHVSLLVDHYEEDWRRLWWVRADGSATVVDVESPAGTAAVAALRAKYPQNARTRLGPAIRIAVERWTAWQSGPLSTDEPDVSTSPSENTG
jgi:PPOX class probable F420-dependent enzyme